MDTERFEVTPLALSSWQTLGVDYGAHHFATNTAGALVGELMSSLGYRKGAPRPLPPHRVARSGLMWE